MLVISREGTSTQSMIPSGAPAATAASRISFAVAIVQSFARGCGLMMIPFLVLSASSVLKIATIKYPFVLAISSEHNYVFHSMSYNVSIMDQLLKHIQK